MGAYYHSTYAIDTRGSLWTWGDNTSGRLGDGTTEMRLQPVKILDDVASADIGYFSGAAVKSDGSLWTWGTNELTGVLGDGTEANHYTPKKVMDGVKSVSVGSGFAAAVKTDGTLWTWGLNVEGCLGDGEDTTGYHLNRRPSPKKIMDGVKSVSCNQGSIAAVKDDGTLWTWGDNDRGQLGNGDTSPCNTPVKILDGVETAEIGERNACAIKNDGTLWVWGWNTSYGLVGDGSGEDQCRPVRVLDSVKFATFGEYNAAAIRDDDTLYMWGDNSDGEIVGTTTSTVKTPVEVFSEIKDIAIGQHHFIIIDANGDMWVWGDNSHGQLGIDSTQSDYVPSKLQLHSDAYYTEEDTDEDGIPDDWERNGLDIDDDGTIDVNLAELGAVVGHKDLFVEVDFMKGEKLDQKQIEMVVNEFMEHDIWLHVDAGPNSVDFTTGEKWGDLSRSDTVDAMEMVLESDEGGETSSDGTPSQYLWETYVNENFTFERRPFFRHCLVAKDIITVEKKDNGELERNSISGISSHIPGQCFMIAGWLDDWFSPYNDNAPAITFMHELGHTLGLMHGGDDDVNYKPNFISVMNYSFQLFGFYNSDDFGYSEHVLPSIDENSLDESQGIDPLSMYRDSEVGTRWYLDRTQEDGRPNMQGKPIAGRSIDFNDNGKIEKSVQVDLNGDGQLTELHCPTTEWALLKFRGGSIGDLGAAQPGSQIQIAVNPAELSPATYEQFEEAAEQLAGESSVVYDVHFDTQGIGDAPLPQSVYPGSRVSVPQDPASKGYVFGGWYTDRECAEPYDFETPVTQNLTLFAKWAEEGRPDTPLPETPTEPTGPSEPSDSDDPCPSEAFEDVDKTQWYHEAVDWALTVGAMNGYADGTFGPDNPLMREQAAAVLWNLMGGSDSSSAAAPHSDVLQDEWYSAGVNWAVAQGYINGYEGTDEFGIGDGLTREQFACILANIALGDQEQVDETALNRFADGSQVSDWARSAMAWAVESGIINGVEADNGTRELQAGRTISRAEMAAMIMNSVNKGVLEIS
ncbi:S-layer homology domain-containing protein [Collinsella ihumii]|uniref:RCC1 domain-containing protein n=1 Tax=Collinsella ihumii TaxID=1720204 RepID=UPI0025AB40B9|nr:S-layer homology domain-containing protein [Collinsella ihumii]MDN0056353.1 S-layer homology domain-containing protein [Collinsella ihumii]